MAKWCATLIARMLVGLLLFSAGAGKFVMGYAKYLEMLLPGLNEMQMVPWVVGAAFLYALPVLELAIGIAVLVGWRTSDALGSAGALFVLLALGSLLSGDAATAAHTTVYVLVAMAGVWLVSDGHNKWALS